MTDAAKTTSLGKTFIWSFLERFGANIVTTIVSVILARIIFPSEYGIVSAISIFTNIATTFVTSGFPSALIRKRNCDQLDYSSMFLFNLLFSTLIYLILFFTAPYISLLLSKNYDSAQLTLFLRISGIGLFFSSVNSFYRAYLSKKMLFRKIFFITITGSIVSGVAGIVMALLGFGAWAIVFHKIIAYVINSILFIIFSKWKISVKVSFVRLKPLLSFGFKIMFSSLLSSVYGEINSLVIATEYSSDDLAFYTKGCSFPKLITVNILSAINSVFFPYLAQLDDKKYKERVKTTNQMAYFIIGPILMGLASISTPFMFVILTKKWEPAAIYMLIMCIDYMFQIVSVINLQVWKAKGNPTFYLIIDIIKKVIGIGLTVLAVMLRLGVVFIAIAALLSSIIATMLTLIPGKRIFGYSIFEQIKDIMPQLISSVVVFFIVYIFVSFSPYGHLTNLIVGILLGVVTYLILSLCFMRKNIDILLSFVKIKKRKKETKARKRLFTTIEVNDYSKYTEINI